MADVSTTQGFRREDRLLLAEDFNRVFARKQSARGKCLIVHGCENDVGRPRLGRVVGKRWGSAVVRNRYRRWLREAFRLAKAELPKADYVAMPVGQLTFAGVRDEFRMLACRVARKLGIG